MIFHYTLLIVDVLLAVHAYRKRKTGLVIWLALLLGTFFATSKVAFLVFGTISAAMLLGQPLFVLMGSLGILLLAQVSGLGTFHDLTVVVRKLLELASKEVLLAIRFFVVAGELMTQGSLARRLVDVMRATFSWMPGGLAIVCIVASAFFTALTGGSGVTLASGAASTLHADIFEAWAGNSLQNRLGGRGGQRPAVAGGPQNGPRGGLADPNAAVPADQTGAQAQAQAQAPVQNTAPGQGNRGNGAGRGQGQRGGQFQRRAQLRQGSEQPAQQQPQQRRRPQRGHRRVTSQSASVRVR